MKTAKIQASWFFYGAYPQSAGKLCSNGGLTELMNKKAGKETIGKMFTSNITFQYHLSVDNEVEKIIADVKANKGKTTLTWNPNKNSDRGVSSDKAAQSNEKNQSIKDKIKTLFN